MSAMKTKLELSDRRSRRTDRFLHSAARGRSRVSKELARCHKPGLACAGCRTRTDLHCRSRSSQVGRWLFPLHFRDTHSMNRLQIWPKQRNCQSTPCFEHLADSCSCNDISMSPSGNRGPRECVWRVWMARCSRAQDVGGAEPLLRGTCFAFGRDRTYSTKP
jgi:hypothetical protein